MSTNIPSCGRGDNSKSMPFVIEFGENLIVEQKYSMHELYPLPGEIYSNYVDVPTELMQARILGYNPTRIFIKDTWYNAIPLHMLVRTKSADDYYRFIYIQINYNTGEYYIGKVNRKKWKERIGTLFRTQGRNVFPLFCPLTGGGGRRMMRP